MSLRMLSCVAALISAVAASKIRGRNAAFDDYVSAFGRDYEHGSPEYDRRLDLFQRRVDFIEHHNAKPDRLWTAGVNALVDRTEEELAALRGYRQRGRQSSRAALNLLAESAEALPTPPESVDWRSKLAMADEVPDQGGCGSCWAVATVSMLQGRYEAQMNNSRTFSMQQLVNCVPNPRECGGTGGCDGATVELAMHYVDRAGLSQESEVPYQGKDGKCNHPMPTNQASSFLGVGSRRGAMELNLQSWQQLRPNKALPLMVAVTHGPVAISLGAESFAYYSSGIFDSCRKDVVIDHAVTLFGYGHENGVKYWNIRNSWGKNWGEAGFIRMKRQATAAEDDAYCGTDSDPSAGVACKPYPEKQTVCGMCGLLFDSVAANFSQNSML